MTTTARKIFKLNDEAIDAIRRCIQTGMIASLEGRPSETTEDLRKLGFAAEEDGSIVPCEIQGVFETPPGLGDKLIAHVAQLVQFSTMTRASFVDLCRQARLELDGQGKYATTPEYDEYFQNVICSRLDYAQQVKESLQKRIANDDSTPPEAA